jgi:hypothetical protein
MPPSVTSIGDGAFYFCPGLKKVNISSIAAWCGICFSSGDANPLCYAHHLYLNDDEITDLVITSEVTNVNDYAFEGCTGLTSVTCKWEEPVSATESVFSESTYNCPLYVPIGTHDKYDNTVPWYRFSQIIEKDMSGIDDLAADDAADVTIVDGAVCVVGNESKCVSVYTVDGKLLKRSIVTPGDRLPLAPGLSIVKVGNHSLKVSLPK